MRAFYTFQLAIETVHAQVYGELIETLIKNPDEQEEVFQAIGSNNAVKRLGEWSMRWTDPEEASFGERLVAFACVEGILFSGPFAVIFYFKTKGLLPGLCKSNEFIARDEAQHMRFACFLFKDRLLEHQRPSRERVHEIVQSCVDVEKDFVKFAISDMPGLNSRSMSQYIEFVADVLLTLMGVPKLFNATNPFSWMNMIGLEGRQNFFEGRVSEYQRCIGAAKTLDSENFGKQNVDITDF
jgi:ribonucleotide reductase beta subunit family protein with ferritin-like domain